jgi:hypothetical protein
MNKGMRKGVKNKRKMFLSFGLKNKLRRQEAG